MQINSETAGHLVYQKHRPATTSFVWFLWLPMSYQQLNVQRLKILNCRPFSFLRILTGCRPFSHGVFWNWRLLIKHKTLRSGLWLAIWWRNYNKLSDVPKANIYNCMVAKGARTKILEIWSWLFLIHTEIPGVVMVSLRCTEHPPVYSW